MPRGTNRLRVDNFLGGLNQGDDPVDIALDEAWNMTNFVPYGDGGAIQQRDGDETFWDFGTGDLLRLFITPGLLVAYENGINGGVGGRIYSTDGVSQWTVYDPGTSSAITENSFEAVNAPVSGGQGPMFYRVENSAGADILRYYTGATTVGGSWTASAGTIPTSKWYLYAGNRVWGVGRRGVLTDATMARVDWSEIGDARNWPAANTLQLAPADGIDYTGAGVFGDLVIVFKRNKAWAIYDLDTGANRALAGVDVGAVNHDTICSTPIGLFFIDPGRGPMITDGFSAKPLENGLKTGDHSSATRAVYFDDHIYLLQDASNLYDYNLRTKTWWQHTYSANPAAMVVNGDQDALFAGRFARNEVDTVLSGGFTYANGNPILPNRRSGYFSLGAAAERKRLSRLFVHGEGLATVKVQRDYTGSQSTVATGGDINAQLLVPTLGVARMPTIEIVKASGDTIRLDSFELDYRVRQK